MFVRNHGRYGTVGCACLYVISRDFLCVLVLP